MSDLVGLNTDDSLSRGNTGFLLVVEVDGSSSGDESKVLHCSGVEVGGDERVELGERVGNVEHLFVLSSGSSQQAISTDSSSGVALSDAEIEESDVRWA